MPCEDSGGLPEVFTDWASRIAAVGSPARPACSRTRRRSRSRIAAVGPAFSPAAQEPDTLPYGGGGAGRLGGAAPPARPAPRPVSRPPPGGGGGGGGGGPGPGAPGPPGGQDRLDQR